MKRTFLWNFEAVVPILDFDFRVTVVALQAVRGHLLERNPWPEHCGPEHRILANFLDLGLTPNFIPEGSDFTPYEHRYTSKITELTGYPSRTKNFQSDGKTLRDFVEHRLGTSIEGALFLCLGNFNKTGRAKIPSQVANKSVADLLNSPVTNADLVGITDAMELILNPMLETGSSIIRMNPKIQQEFPNLATMATQASVGKTFGEMISLAVAPILVGEVATA
jgi:hypothetical protein